MTNTLAETAPVAEPAAADPSNAGAKSKTGAHSGATARAPRAPAHGAERPFAQRATRHHPVLDQLAALYPHLFGAQFRPLKRGIFHDLLAAHPQLLERDALKAALGLHTRSTRYLMAVAEGQKRHDLQGQAVEDMASEHVYQALLEVFRRRTRREGDDAPAKLRQRIVAAFEASGLSREAYAELVRSRDEAANQVLDEALAEAALAAARDEALLRAFEASAQAVASFADMYGMDTQSAARALERARRRRPAG